MCVRKKLKSTYSACNYLWDRLVWTVQIFSLEFIGHESNLRKRARSRPRTQLITAYPLKHDSSSANPCPEQNGYHRFPYRDFWTAFIQNGDGWPPGLTCLYMLSATEEIFQLSQTVASKHSTELFDDGHTHTRTDRRTRNTILNISIHISSHLDLRAPIAERNRSTP